MELGQTRAISVLSDYSQAILKEEASAANLSVARGGSPLGLCVYRIESTKYSRVALAVFASNCCPLSLL